MLIKRPALFAEGGAKQWVKALIRVGMLSVCALSEVALAQSSPASNKPANASQASASPQESADKAVLARELGRFTSLQGRFTQAQSDKAGKLLSSSQGRFEVKRPGLYRWESESPYAQTVIGDGKTVWLYDPDLEQVTQSQQAAMPFNAARLLSGDLDALLNDFHVTYEAAPSTQGQAQVQRFHLIPKQADKMPFRTLTLSLVAGTPQSLAFVDTLGQLTELSFAELLLNPALADSRFTFVPPAGVDVLIND